MRKRKTRTRKVGDRTLRAVVASFAPTAEELLEIEYDLSGVEAQTRGIPPDVEEEGPGSPDRLLQEVSRAIDARFSAVLGTSDKDVTRVRVREILDALARLSDVVAPGTLGGLRPRAWDGKVWTDANDLYVENPRRDAKDGQFHRPWVLAPEFRTLGLRSDASLTPEAEKRLRRSGVEIADKPEPIANVKVQVGPGLF